MNKPNKVKSFKRDVVAGKNLSLVQFKIDWNGACQIILPIYEELAGLYHGKAMFFTVDAESEKVIANEYGVKEIPTILFFKNGQIVDHVTGLVSKNALVLKIENALNGIIN